jgi:hypothetical protein
MIDGNFEVIQQDAKKDDVQLDPAVADAWACAMAELLWNDPTIREKMSTHFQRVVDKMVEVTFGNVAAS